MSCWKEQFAPKLKGRKQPRKVTHCSQTTSNGSPENNDICWLQSLLCNGMDSKISGCRCNSGHWTLQQILPEQSFGQMLKIFSNDLWISCISPLVHLHSSESCCTAISNQKVVSTRPATRECVVRLLLEIAMKVFHNIFCQFPVDNVTCKEKHALDNEQLPSCSDKLLNITQALWRTVAVPSIIKLCPLALLKQEKTSFLLSSQANQSRPGVWESTHLSLNRQQHSPQRSGRNPVNWDQIWFLIDQQCQGCDAVLYMRSSLLVVSIQIGQFSTNQCRVWEQNIITNSGAMVSKQNHTELTWVEVETDNKNTKPTPFGHFAQLKDTSQSCQWQFFDAFLFSVSVKIKTPILGQRRTLGNSKVRILWCQSLCPILRGVVQKDQLSFFIFWVFFFHLGW